MRALYASNILRIWELGQQQHPLDRALTILAAGCADLSPAQLAELTIGARDRALIELRELTLGEEMEARASCPRCGETLEFRLKTSELRGQGAANDTGEARSAQPIIEGRAGAQAGLGEEIVIGGRRFALRVPTSRDLAAVASSADAAQARRSLACRCLVDPGDPQGIGISEQLSEEAVVEIERRLTGADPQGEMLVNLSCPACAHAWQLAFDIAAWFWSEISALAMRLFAEVDALARAYGWSERDILAMSAARRRAYLEMA